MRYAIFDGKSYFDTGYKPQLSKKFRYTVALKDFQSSIVFGERSAWNSSVTPKSCTVEFDGTYFRSYCTKCASPASNCSIYTYDWMYFNNYTVDASKYYLIDTTCNYEGKNTTQIYEDGTLVVDAYATCAGAQDADYSILVGILNNGGSAAATPFNGKLYNICFYEDDILVHDYRFKEVDGVGKMYDAVTGEYYDNKGTGAITVVTTFEAEPDTITLPSVGGSQTITIEGEAWTATTIPDWITLSDEEGEDEGTTIATAKEYKGIRKGVITPSETEVGLTIIKPSKEITITSDSTWTAETDADWITLAIDGDKLTISTGEHDEAMEGNVKLKTTGYRYGTVASIHVNYSTYESDLYFVPYTEDGKIYFYEMVNNNKIECPSGWGFGTDDNGDYITNNGMAESFLDLGFKVADETTIDMQFYATGNDGKYTLSNKKNADANGTIRMFYAYGAFYYDYNNGGSGGRIQQSASSTFGQYASVRLGNFYATNLLTGEVIGTGTTQDASTVNSVDMYLGTGGSSIKVYGMQVNNPL